MHSGPDLWLCNISNWILKFQHNQRAFRHLKKTSHGVPHQAAKAVCTHSGVRGDVIIGGQQVDFGTHSLIANPLRERGR